MNTQVLSENLASYREAAQILGLSPQYIAHLASQRTLHPIKLTGKREKYLHREELAWYKRKREGSDEPNPYVGGGVDDGVELVAAVAKDVNIDAATQSIKLTTNDVAEATQLVGLSVVLLVLALLVAIFLNQKPDQEKLNLLKRAPQFQQMRQAIRHLADEIAA